MIVFPNAKINLGLQVSAKRPDGFHNIATIFFPVPCTDVLEVVRTDSFSFSVTGLTISGTSDENLCSKAYSLLQKDFSLPPVAVHLHKIIPMGAGLGGGSADGAFMLSLLNQLFQLKLSEASLSKYALELGSDCPFFLLNKPAFASGRGEILETLEIPQLQGKKILLVCPGIHINTGWAFNQMQSGSHHTCLQDIIKEPIESWKGRLTNDFEPVVYAAYPQLKTIQDQLYAAGAKFAGMTGTGSTQYGIFDQLPGDYSEHFESFYRLIPL